MKILDRVYWYPKRGFLDCNSYLVDDDLCVLIDPGSGSVRNRRDLLEGLEEDGFKPEDIDLIVNTHSHPDHSGANRWFKHISNAKIAIHKLEEEYMKTTPQTLMRFFARFLGVADFKPDLYLSEKLETGEWTFEVLHTPGHSPGSVSLYCGGPKILVCGDVVLSGSIGRVDFPSGSLGKLKNSLDLLSKLEVEFLLPGHGDIVKGKKLVEENFEYVKGVFFRW